MLSSCAWLPSGNCRMIGSSPWWCLYTSSILRFIMAGDDPKATVGYRCEVHDFSKADI